VLFLAIPDTDQSLEQSVNVLIHSQVPRDVLVIVDGQVVGFGKIGWKVVFLPVFDEAERRRRRWWWKRRKSKRSINSTNQFVDLVKRQNANISMITPFTSCESSMRKLRCSLYEKLPISVGC
jgi:hypothetical protein